MKNLLLGIAVGLASSVVVAQDTGWYVGGALGQVTAKDFCNGLPGGITTCDDTDTTVKALGGYQFSRNFAVEFGAMAAGTVEARGAVGRLTVDTAIGEVTAVAILPLGETFSAFGKFGLYTSAVETTLTALGANTTERKTNSDLTYGVGASWAFMPKFSVRAEWQRYSKVDAGNLGKSDADVVSLGLVYRFF